MEMYDLISNIKKELPNKAIDIYESLELLQSVLSDSIDEIKDLSSSNIVERNFDSSLRLIEMAMHLNKYEKDLSDILLKLDIETDNDYEDSEEQNERREIPDYDLYVVDNKIEHTLYENFTHIRPFGFRIANEKFVEAKTWQEMLIKTCEFLFEKDREKFFSFENKSSMNGRKNKYFSKNKKELRKPGYIKNSAYIELNQSSNSIRNFIIKLLREYEYSIIDYKVYFRADYTNLQRHS